MHNRRSEIFRMAKDATGIDAEKTLNEAEVEVLVSWMTDTRKAVLGTKAKGS